MFCKCFILHVTTVLDARRVEQLNTFRNLVEMCLKAKRVCSFNGFVSNTFTGWPQKLAQ